MYRSFTARNFRGLRHLTLDPLERVNLITGMNNVGKTALLEAIYLHLGPTVPDLSIRVNAWRGLERFAPVAEEVWGTLFTDGSLDDPILLTHTDEDGQSCSLSIRLAERTRSQVLAPDSGETSTRAPSGPPATNTAGERELVLEYDDAGHHSITRAYPTKDGSIQAETSDSVPSRPGVFLNARVRLPREDAQRFYQLEQTGRQEEVTAVLRQLDHRLQRLGIALPAGLPSIGADLGDGKLIPVGLAGEGMVRLASIVCAIATAPSGTVLIDEVDNGLHYTSLENVWAAIAHAARRSDVQVFATTHSWECIRAAHAAFAANAPYDFRLHRLERTDTGVRAVSYDQTVLTTSIENGLEVR